MAMGMAGPGAAMSAQQYHMAMMQKHQQHMKVMMQQRGLFVVHSKFLRLLVALLRF